MPSYKVLNPICWSGRRERGETVKMSEEEAASFGEQYVEKVELPVNTESVQTEETTVMTKETVSKLKKPQVVAELTKLGVEFDESEAVAPLRELLEKTLFPEGEAGSNSTQTDESKSE